MSMPSKTLWVSTKRIDMELIASALTLKIKRTVKGDGRESTYSKQGNKGEQKEIKQNRKYLIM